VSAARAKRSHARPVAARVPALLSRVGAAAALIALLAGPTPGAVGSCGGDDLDQTADLREYCQTRDELVCVRRSLRKEITHEERDDCRREAIARCQDRFWLPQCEPTRRQARACINALQSLDTLETPEDRITECSPSQLCGIPVPDAPDEPDAPNAPIDDPDSGAEAESN
jgi:hypothetical protein